MTSPQKALVVPTVFCEVTLKVYVNPASRLGTVILVVSTLLIKTGTGLLIMYRTWIQLVRGSPPVYGALCCLFKNASLAPWPPLFVHTALQF